MTGLQLESVDEPFRSHPELAELAMRALHTAEFSGSPLRAPGRALNWDLVLAVGDSLGAAPTSYVIVELKRARSGKESERAAPEQVASMRRALERLLVQAEGSPRPADEWAPVLRTLDEDLLAQLLGTSVSSVRRYSSGERATPQVVAEKLHFIALLLAELAGSYNDYGMRRWFSRPRSALDGKAPANLMGRQFEPDGPDGQRIRALAESVRVA